MAQFRAFSGAFGDSQKRAEKRATRWLGRQDSNLEIPETPATKGETLHWTSSAKEACVVETDRQTDLCFEQPSARL